MGKSTIYGGLMGFNQQNGDFNGIYDGYPLVNCHKKLWKDPPCFMGKSTISMAIFHCYVSLPEGTSSKHIRWCNPIQNTCLSTGITLLNILSHTDWCQFKSAGDVVIICLMYSICWIHHRRDSQGYSTHLKHFESTNQDQASWYPLVI